VRPLLFIPTILAIWVVILRLYIPLLRLFITFIYWPVLQLSYFRFVFNYNRYGLAFFEFPALTYVYEHKIEWIAICKYQDMYRINKNNGL
jgi:hypothetical protein